MTEQEEAVLARHHLQLLRSVRDRLATAAEAKFQEARTTIDRAPATADRVLGQADTVVDALLRAAHLTDQEQQRHNRLAHARRFRP